MSRANGLASDHSGQTVRFWHDACRADRTKACANLGQMLTRYCEGGSPWACNELGILGATGRAASPSPLRLFGRACAAGYQPACTNRATAETGRDGPLVSGDPALIDFVQLLQNTKGPLPDQTPVLVMQRACRDSARTRMFMDVRGTLRAELAADRLYCRASRGSITN